MQEAAGSSPAATTKFLLRKNLESIGNLENRAIETDVWVSYEQVVES